MKPRAVQSAARMRCPGAGQVKAGAAPRSLKSWDARQKRAALLSAKIKWSRKMKTPDRPGKLP